MMLQSRKVSAIGVGLLLACGILLTSANVLKWSRRAPTDPQRSVEDWPSYAIGPRMGLSAAPVTVVVFSDYNCRFCARFWLRLAQIVRKHPESLTVVYRHYPLDSLGMGAARAATCAAAQNRFEDFTNLIFAHIDSLQAWSWTRVALAAGIPKTAAFVECLGSPSTLRLIEADIASAQRIGAIGTPTFLVNGDLYVGDAWDLERIVRDHIAETTQPSEDTRLNLLGAPISEGEGSAP
jgi:predicted DsbA family dithiol-disulfide isomerase